MKKKSKVNIKSKVILYYVNDSDGDTLFFDNKDKLNIIKRVSPKKGRVVHFDNNKLHASWIHLHLPSSLELAKNFIDATQFVYSKDS